MNKLLLILTAIIFCDITFAFGDEPASPSNKQEQLPRKNLLQKHLGGFVEDRRAQKGYAAIVNAQESAQTEWLLEAGEVFSKDIKISVKVESGAFNMPNPAIVGNVTVFVVDDETLPMSLIAPESRWAVVNVAKLKSNAEPFFKARVEKTIVRALALLLGGSDSQYPMCVTGSVLKASDLDRYTSPQLPIDVVDRISKNAASYGITPYKITTYRKACEEGWAPQPTNDIQKAVWEKVHAIPDKPITIEYDPKKDK